MNINKTTFNQPYLNDIVLNPQNYVLNIKERNVIFLDFETTGIDIANDEIVQVAIGYYSYNDEDKMYCLTTNQWYVKPNKQTYLAWQEKFTNDIINQCLKHVLSQLSNQNKDILVWNQMYQQADLNQKLVLSLTKLQTQNKQLYDKAQTFISQKKAFLIHQNEIVKQAYFNENSISQTKNQQILSEILANKIIVTYNGNAFDTKFLTFSNYACIDVYELVKRFIKKQNSNYNVLVLNTNQNNQELVLENLKQETVGQALNTKNFNTHDANNDIKQLSFIFNVLIKNVVYYLNLNGLNITNELPLVDFAYFSAENYFKLLNQEINLKK